jgi:hypothetical protein
MGLTATTAAAIKQLAAQEAEQLAPLEAAHVRDERANTIISRLCTELESFSASIS